MRAWIDVAVLAKTRNSKGRFAVHATAGLPFLLEEGDEVAFVPPQTDVPRNGVVSAVRLLDDSSADVEFEGIQDAGIARQMVGMHCLIKRDLVDDSVFESAAGAWEGWAVVDEKEGELGFVSDLIENPAQDLLEVERPDGSTVLVPVVEEIVRSVDVKSATVYVNLPQGLLDL